MFRWTCKILFLSILILLCSGQDFGVCKKHDLCNGAVYNNVSYTCERRYMKSTRCQLITLTRVINIMETQRMYAEFEEGLSALDKTIKSLSCQLQSRPYCVLNSDCQSNKAREKCGDNVTTFINKTENNDEHKKATQRCQEGFRFHCKGKETGTSSEWCLKHCSVGWAQCNEYCDCKCRKNQLLISTPAPLNISIPKCNRHMKLSCLGKLEIIPNNWCQSYCRRNGALCLKYCNCECVRKNVKGFFTRHNTPQTTTVYIAVKTTEIPMSTRPTFGRTTSLITCRLGFQLICVSSNKVYSSEWCTVSCMKRDCPSFCSCKCMVRQRSGFLPVRTNEGNDEIKFPNGINTLTSTNVPGVLTKSTATTIKIPSTTEKTIPTKHTKMEIQTTQPKTKQINTTSTNQVFTSKRPITTSIPTTVTTTTTTTLESVMPSPTPTLTSFTTPVTTLLATLTNSPYLDMCSTDFVFKCRGKQFGIRQEWCTKQCVTGSPNCQNYCVCGCVRVKNETIKNKIITTAPEFDFVTTTPAIISTKVTNFCHAGHMSCRWKGPNLGPVNHDILRWCQNVCSINSAHCSELRHMCECKCLRYKKRVRLCRPSEQMKHNPAIAAWCRRNCIAGYCPKTHCSCEYVLI